MNSNPSPGGRPAPATSGPENEDDDPVGDNQPVTDATGPDAPDVADDGEGDGGSNSGAVRTGNDGVKPTRSSDAGSDIPAEETPEGSDARPSDRLNGHRPEEFPTGRSGRQPSSDSKLPQSSRG